jgi:hypothetical protein
MEPSNIPPNDSEPEQVPEIGLKWSKKSLLITLAVTMLLAVLCVFGYLIYQEYRQAGIADPSSTQQAPDIYDKLYSNDSWGFKFSYPQSWWPVIGTFDEGDYFFASEQINFTDQLDQGQAQLEVKCYKDWKNMPNQAWLTFMQTNYLPYGKILQNRMYSLNGYAVQRQLIQLNTPQNPNTGYWDMAVVSPGNSTHYLFIFQTDGPATHDKFDADFESILNSLKFYKGFDF